MHIIIIILSALLLTAFFAGVETALLQSEAMYTGYSGKIQAAGFEITGIMLQRPAKFLAAMRTGKIISIGASSVSLYFYLSGKLGAIVYSGAAVLIFTLIICFITIYIIAILIPLIIARVSPGFFLKYMSAPAMFFFLLLYPFTKVVMALFPVRNIKADKLYFRQGILENLNIDRENKDGKGKSGQDILLFRNIMDLSNIKIREIMVPRTEIEAVPVASSLSQVREKFISTRFSRILVYSETIDNITGYFEVKDIFRNPEDVSTIIRKLSVVPETMQADKLLKTFVDEKRSIALVVDEFGGTSGMITIEDLLEEIVGDIEDEHDSRDLVERTVKPGEYIFSGRLEIDYLNEMYSLDLPEEPDYETLAGMILYFHGSIPAATETVRIGKLSIKVLRATSTKLELVNLKVGE